MARPSKMRKIGSLEVIEIPGQPKSPCIVFFHGYGADATDLVPLANVISAPPGTTWLFPNGTMEVELGPHFSARAWFPIDIEALDRARAEGTHRDLSNTTPPGIKQAREKVFEMLKTLNIPLSQVIFGGFSQGAMLATALTLYAPEPPKGLIIMSGALLDGKIWAEKAKNRTGLSFYQSHGTRDDLLGLQGAQALEKTLLDAGLKGKLQTFSGGHEIPQEVLHGVNNYLRGLPK
ncbi:MAG: esterase [Oligoflexia bacterium]|nr:esterase [Oligoflexia bacterium]